MNAFKEYLARIAETEPQSLPDLSEASNLLGNFPVTTQHPPAESKPSTGTDILNEAASKAAEQAAAQAREQERLAEIQRRKDWIRQHDIDTAERDQNFLNAPVLSTGELPIAQGLIQFKEMYASADDPAYQKAMGMTADQIREYAGNEANRLRTIAQAAGYDLSGYDSDVSLDRATTNLLSNEAHAQNDILHGKYSQTTDQFYDQEYRNLRLRGLSMSDARDLAGKNALQYQTEKMAYMSDMLGGYGLNGGYLNELGTQIVGRMGLENSDLGNYYGKMYHSPASAQDRINTVEDALQSHAFGLENANLAAYLNEIAANNTFKRDLYKLGTTSNLNLRNASQIAGQKHQYDLDKMTYADALKQAAEYRKVQQVQAAIQQKLAQVDDWYKKGVLNDKEYISAVAGVQGITLSLTKGKENLTKDHLAGIKNILDVDVKQLTALEKRLATELKPEDKKVIQAEIKELNDEIKGLKQQYGDLLFGVEPDNGVEGVGDFSETDDAANLNAIATILAARPNATEAKQFQAVRNFIPKDRTDRYVQEQIDKARAHMKGR